MWHTRRRRWQSWWRPAALAALIAPLVAALAGPATVVSANSHGVAISGGRHFTQAGGNTGRGFDLRDHADR